MSSRATAMVVFWAGLVLAAATTRAQNCVTEWLTRFPADELDGMVYATAVYDADGAGPGLPALYVGGTFTHAGGLLVNKIAKWSWNGQQMAWSVLGAANNPGVPTGSGVYAMTVWNDGTGDALYVGGSFPAVSGPGQGLVVNHIAKWNGSAWARLGPITMPAGVANGVVWALTTFDEDGSGPLPAALYVGGTFLHAGDVAEVDRIAKWDGSAWYALAGGVDNFVDSLEVFDDDGSGTNLPGLYVGGGFLVAGSLSASRVAKWSKVGSNMTWSKLTGIPPADGCNNSVYELRVYDEDESGPILPALYVGGSFTTAGGSTASRIAKWFRNGSALQWSAVEEGVFKSGAGASVLSMTVHDEVEGDDVPNALFVGGVFDVAGPISANNIAKFDGKDWYPLGSGVDDAVRAMCSFDPDGAGTAAAALVVAGDFESAGGEPAGHLALWTCNAQGQEVLPGDLNCDGEVNFLDINRFVLALTDEDAYIAMYPNCPFGNRDINGDGEFDFRDINRFVLLLTGGA